MPGYPGANRGKITNQPAWMTNCGGGLGIGNSGAIKRAINQRASANCGCNLCKTHSRTNVLAGGVGRGTGEFRPNADGFNVLRPYSHRGPGHIPGHGSGSFQGYLLKTDRTKTNIAVMKTPTNEYILHIVGSGSSWKDAASYCGNGDGAHPSVPNDCCSTTACCGTISNYFNSETQLKGTSVTLIDQTSSWYCFSQQQGATTTSFFLQTPISWYGLIVAI